MFCRIWFKKLKSINKQRNGIENEKGETQRKGCKMKGRTGRRDWVFLNIKQLLKI